VPKKHLLYWGTLAYATQQILLRGLPNLDFTIRPSERKLWDPQLRSPGGTYSRATLQDTIEIKTNTYVCTVENVVSSNRVRTVRVSL
jgi:hypothetical protein